MRAASVATAQWWILLATIAVTPLAFSTWTFDVFNLTALTVLWVGAAIAVGLQVWLLGAAQMGERRRGTRSYWLPRRWGYIAFYIGILVLSTATSRAPMVSLLGQYGRYGGLVTTLPIIAVALMLARALAESPERRVQLLGAVVTSGVLGALYLVAQERGVDAFSWFEPWSARPRHPPGALGNSNFSGAHVALALGPALVLASERRGKVRVVLAVVVLVLLAGVGVSQSRGAIMAVLAACAVVVARSTPPMRRRLTAAVAGGLALLGLVAVATNDAGLTELVGTGTATERIDLWEVALEGAADRPILGGGPDLYTLTFADHAGPELAGVVSDEPHNVLLDHLDGSGLLGAGAWLGVVMAIVASARMSINRRRLTPWLAMGAGYLAQAAVSIDVVPLQLWGWVAAAGVLGLADTRDSWSTDANAKLQPAAVVVGSAAAILMVVVALGPFRADMAHRRGIEAANLGDHDRATAQLTQATDRHGWEPRFHRRLGIQLVLASRVRDDQDLTMRARAELDRTLELLPGDPVATEWRSSIEE